MPAKPKTAVVSAVLGVVLLAAMFSFAVFLPKVDDDAEPAGADSSEAGEAGASTPVELPDELSNGMVAVDLGTLPEELTQQLGAVEDLQPQEESVAEGLERVFGVPGAFRVYAADDGSSLANLTVLDKEPGLFVPDALPIDPEVLGITRAASELVKSGDATCSINWGQEVPAGQPVDPTVMPQAVRCQLGGGGRTYEITAQGLAVDDAVSVLDALAG